MSEVDKVSDKARILIVDDMATNRMLAAQALIDGGFEVFEAANGEEALKSIDETEFDTVLLDVLMPGMSGLEVCERVRQNPKHKFLPIIILSSLDTSDDVIEGMHVGATEYLHKPFTPAELVARTNTAVTQKKLTDNLDDISAVFFTLARMVEARDSNTGSHCDRLSYMGIVLGELWGLSPEDIEGLRRGGVLHDIGKLGIPDRILLKPGKLTEDEWVIMKEHVNIGDELCAPLRTMDKTRQIVKYHHERWNGSGYPEGLSGEDIPLLARIFQLLDIYDALANSRPYKAAFPMEKIISIFEEEVGLGYMDPNLAGKFIEILKTSPEILERPTGDDYLEATDKEKGGEIAQRILDKGYSKWYENNDS